MKSVVYTGDPCNLSRFGWVTPGQRLDLTESEYATVQGNPRFDDTQPLKKLTRLDRENLRRMEIQQMRVDDLRRALSAMWVQGKCRDVRRDATPSQIMLALMKAEGLA